MHDGFYWVRRMKIEKLIKMLLITTINSITIILRVMNFHCYSIAMVFVHQKVFTKRIQSPNSALFDENCLILLKNARKTKRQDVINQLLQMNTFGSIDDYEMIDELEEMFHANWSHYT